MIRQSRYYEDKTDRLKVYDRILEDTDLRKAIDDFSKDFLRDIDTDDDDLMYESFRHNRSRMKEGISLEGILGLDNWEKDWNGEIGGEFASTDACRCLMGIISEKSPDDILFYIKLKNSFIKNILLLLKEKIQKTVIKGAQGLEDLIDGNTDKESSQKSINNMMSFGKVLLIYTIFKKMWKRNKKSTENYINNIITHFGYDEEFLLNKYTKKMNLLTTAVYGL